MLGLSRLSWGAPCFSLRWVGGALIRERGFMTRVALVVGLALLLAACSFTETGTGSFACEACPGVPVNLVCTKNAGSFAQQDATAKAKAKAGAHKLTVGAFDLDGPAACVRRGNQWFVDVKVIGHFNAD